MAVSSWLLLCSLKYWRSLCCNQSCFDMCVVVNDLFLLESNDHHSSKQCQRQHRQQQGGSERTPRGHVIARVCFNFQPNMCHYRGIGRMQKLTPSLAVDPVAREGPMVALLSCRFHCCYLLSGVVSSLSIRPPRCAFPWSSWKERRRP